MITNFIVAFVLVVSSVVYLKLATHFQIIDKPNYRSSHTNPTIKGGGILFLIALCLFFILSKGAYLYFFLGTFLIAFVSFIDDLKDLSAKQRLPFQLISICLLLFQIFGKDIYFLWIPVLCIVGIAFINLYNFMDGINGITGMYSFVVLMTLYLVNLEAKILEAAIFKYQFTALVVFGFYNFRKKAKFFAGDIGSITLAMIVFFTGLFLIVKLESPLLALTVIVYSTDSILTLLHRKFLLKENITEAHRHHLYEKIVDQTSLSHIQTSALYAVIQTLVGCIIVTNYTISFNNQLLIFLASVIFFILIYIFLFFRLKTNNN